MRSKRPWLDSTPSAKSRWIGLPEPTLGEKKVACVVLEADASLKLGTLREHCLKHLPFVRVPRELRVVEELPRTDSGKISRSRLKKKLLAEG